MPICKRKTPTIQLRVYFIRTEYSNSVNNIRLKRLQVTTKVERDTYETNELFTVADITVLLHFTVSFYDIKTDFFL